MLYEQKIDKNNKDHLKMLFDIWNIFFKNYPNIKEIDQKWSKYIFKLIYNLNFIYY